MRTISLLMISIVLLSLVSCAESSKLTDVDTITIENLVAYYPFNGNALDENNNLYNGIVNSATLTTDRFGNNDSAYNFDGIDDYIIAGQIPSFTGDDEFTISTWVMWDESGTPKTIISKYSAASNQREWLLGIPGEGGNFYGALYSPDANNNNYVYAPYNLAWNHLVYVKTAEKLKLYLNGELADATLISTTLVDGTADVYIGASQHSQTSPDYFFKGKIDDIRIYGQALSEEDILILYQED